MGKIIKVVIENFYDDAFSHEKDEVSSVCSSARRVIIDQTF